MNEFELINMYFSPLAGFNLMDNDGVSLAPNEGMKLVVSKDMLVEDVHFFAYDSPDMVARKAIRVNLSDIASMGARPLSFLLGLAVPDKFMNEGWFCKFASGLKSEIDQYDVRIIGGDTTRSSAKLTVSITMFGEIPIDGVLLSRKGACVGDVLCVSGTIGDSALGLIQRKQGGSISGQHFNPALDMRYLLPEPRVQLGGNIRNIASACIDVSDGLVLNAEQLAAASNVRIRLCVDDVPLSDDVRGVGGVLEYAITGGDDYELLFTVPLAKVHVLSSIIATPITIIGEVIDGDVGVDLVRDNGEAFCVKNTGYSHG